MKRVKKMRYDLILGDNKLGEYQSISAVATELGCTYQYLYQSMGNEGVINYKGKTYQIVDKLK